MIRDKIVTVILTPDEANEVRAALHHTIATLHKLSQDKKIGKRGRNSIIDNRNWLKNIDGVFRIAINNKGEE